MTKLDRLGGALKEVEAPLGEALHEYSPFMGWLDSDLQLSYSQCGIATAALQIYLAEKCGIVTKRRIATLNALPPRPADNSPGRHVVLSSDDGRTICPTYTQFFELVGLSAALAQQSPEAKALLPESKIALFDDDERFGRDVAERALQARDTVQTVLATQALDLFRGHPNPLEIADDDIVTAAYQSIWRPHTYTPFSFEAQRAMRFSGEFGEVVRNIVDTMA